MAIWLCRAGAYGEYEAAFLRDSKIYCTMPNTNFDLAINDKFQLRHILQECHPDAAPNSISNWLSALTIFSKTMHIGEYVFLPSKKEKVFYVASICSNYHYDETKLPSPHWREVKWYAQKIPKNAFEKDILYSLGAYRTICKVKQEMRILEVLNNYG